MASVQHETSPASDLLSNSTEVTVSEGLSLVDVGEGAAAIDRNPKDVVSKRPEPKKLAHPDAPDLVELLLELLSPTPLPPELVLYLSDFSDTVCAHCDVVHPNSRLTCQVCNIIITDCDNFWRPRCTICSHRRCAECGVVVCDACFEKDDQEVKMDECYTCGRQYCGNCVEHFDGEPICHFCVLSYYF